MATLSFLINTPKRTLNLTIGFLLIHCQKGLLAMGNSDQDVALGWLFIHMEDRGGFFSCPLFCVTRPLSCWTLWVYAYIDIDIDAAVVQTAKGGSGPESGPEQIGVLADPT
jgi:hypothetical protein